MELRLQMIESFPAQGSDGNRYKVRAYDRLALVPGTADRWEPMGQIEYRLEDGRHVGVGSDGTMRLAGSDVVLTPAPAHA
jgi:hypothetical protein